MVKAEKIKRLFFLLSLLLFCSGCQKMVPKLPEEKQVTIGEVLEAPESFYEIGIKMQGVLYSLKDRGLVLREKTEEIKISTKSSGIDCRDFLRKKVEVGGKLKKVKGELMLELDWIGLASFDKGREVSESKKIKLAEVLGLEEKEIEVVSIEPVEWPDTSLGAPEEGKMYLQVLTPGFKIVYKAKGQSYEVHTNEDGSMAVLLKPRTEL